MLIRLLSYVKNLDNVAIVIASLFYQIFIAEQCNAICIKLKILMNIKQKA